MRKYIHRSQCITGVILCRLVGTLNRLVLNSKRSEECLGFTIMCAFYFNFSICVQLLLLLLEILLRLSTSRLVSDRKLCLNLCIEEIVFDFRCSFFNNGKSCEKMSEKRKYLQNNSIYYFRFRYNLV